MKNARSLHFLLIFLVALCLGSCGSPESSNEKSGDTTKTQDSSLLNNYNNEYPNNRIHMQDSNAAKDSSRKNDSVKK